MTEQELEALLTGFAAIMRDKGCYWLAIASIDGERLHAGTTTVDGELSDDA